MAGVAFLYWLAAMLIDNEVVAQGDIEPPRMLSMKVEPTFVDTTNSAALITLTVQITDDLSGLQYIDIFFGRFSQDGRVQSPEVEWFPPQPPVPESGTLYNGIYVMVAELPQYLAHGRWYLSRFGIFDKTDNRCNWHREQWSTVSSESECLPAIELPYFVNVMDSGPPATATPTSTPSPTSTPDLIATETAISQHIATSVAATLTAIARPAPESTMTPQPGRLYLPSLKE